MNVSKIASYCCAGLVAGLSAVAGSIYDIPIKTLEGKDSSLKPYQGKVVLVVNVASQCGYTRQYAPLEKLHRDYKDKGLVIVGVPSNDFGGQEPGSPTEIKEFCTSKFDVTFPLYEKVGVRPGSTQHALYQWLTGADSPYPGPVKWNFNKFLISGNGQLLARFESKVEPDSAELKAAIDKALASR
ncbi:MAG: glutathione peroxidase [Verrucomicrobiales bacterium]|nr:glutathione peroxidase [Verrucomicrobiales bacterium]MCP5526358.1 glutathione peroxidase [Verrucomicrobiales bacterium]